MLVNLFSTHLFNDKDQKMEGVGMSNYTLRIIINEQIYAEYKNIIDLITPLCLSP